MLWEFIWWLILSYVRIVVGLAIGFYVLLVPWKYVKVSPKVRCFIWVHDYESIWYHSRDEDDISEYTHHKCKHCGKIKYNPPTTGYGDY